MWRLGALLVAAAATEAAVVTIYSLQRHGARNVLPKGFLLTETDLVGGPTLLPAGQRQTYAAGAAFRARYIDNATCGATCLAVETPGLTRGTKYGVVGQPGVGFGNFDVYVRSSALDRSIMSGLCFLNGIFPADPTAPTPTTYLPTGAQVVPIYTQSDQEDILIRAYTKCPVYQAALDAWFRTDEFAAASSSSQPVRDAVKAVMPHVDTSLENWWNVYDAINVWRTYGIGDPTPNFTDAQFVHIQSLAFWLETAKMRSNLTGSTLGGVALADLAAYLRASAQALTAGSQVFYRLLSLSGHYNTQLGVLAALALDTHPPATAAVPWFTSIPKLAAVMAFELHALPQQAQQAGANATWDYYVRLVAQDGPSAAYVTIPMPCASDAAAAAVGVGACPLSGFLAYAEPRAYMHPAQWCTACNNGAVMACRVAASSTNGDGGTHVAAWAVAVAVVLTLVGCVLLMALAVGAARLWRLRQQRSDGGGGGPCSPHSAELVPQGYVPYGAQI